jgi:hypothetical protein
MGHKATSHLCQMDQEARLEQALSKSEKLFDDYWEWISETRQTADDLATLNATETKSEFINIVLDGLLDVTFKDRREIVIRVELVLILNAGQIQQSLAARVCLTALVRLI